MSLLGLDVGTTGAKAVVFSADGEALGAGYSSYPLHQPKPGWAELDPEEVWNAVVQAVRRAVVEAGTDDPVRALAVSSQGEAVVPVDENLRPLANSAVSFCRRTDGYERFWQGRLSDRELYSITGQKHSPMYTVHKLLWLRDHEAEAFHKARWFLCYGDFVSARLGAPPCIDFSNAARTFCFDINRCVWSEAILEGTGVSVERLPKPLPCGTGLGTIDSSVAEELGLRKDTSLVLGAHDQPAGALGAGVVSTGMAVDSIGTVECLTASLDRPMLNDRMYENGFPCYAHAAPGRFVALAWIFSGGSILRWFLQVLASDVLVAANKSGRDAYDLLLADLPEGPSPVLLLPYFAGSATPNFDTSATGAIFGLTLATTRADLVKAILDGISFEMRLLLDKWEEAGIRVGRVRAVGGGAKSTAWLQQKADVYGRPVAAVNVPDAACLGMAIAAGVAIGEFGSMEEATSAIVRETEVYEPQADVIAHYDDRYRQYLRLYPATKSVL